MGSWKIIAISLPLTRLASRSGSPTSSRPPSLTEPPVILPGGAGMSPIAAWTVTDFPQPDSPTIASVLPASTPRLTPRTAWTTPPCVANSTRRPSISEQPHSTDLSRGSSASRSPSPSRLKARTITLITAAGAMNSCG